MFLTANLKAKTAIIRRQGFRCRRALAIAVLI